MTTGIGQNSRSKSGIATASCETKKRSQRLTFFEKRWRKQMAVYTYKLKSHNILETWYMVYVTHDMNVCIQQSYWMPAHHHTTYDFELSNSLSSQFPFPCSSNSNNRKCNRNSINAVLYRQGDRSLFLTLNCTMTANPIFNSWFLA